MAILSDTAIREELRLGMMLPLTTSALRIKHSGFTDLHARVQPNSIDLVLSPDEILVAITRLLNYDARLLSDCGNPNLWRSIGPDNILLPGDFALCHTDDEVEIPDDLCGELTGRSSVARGGLIVHMTAGLIDSGFKGNITLEVANLAPWPIILPVGETFCQLILHTLEGTVKNPYNGRYQGARGTGLTRFGS